MSDEPNYKVKHMIAFENGMVMVFDHSGKQLPDFQGSADDDRERILAALDSCGEHTIYEISQSLHSDMQRVSREMFMDAVNPDLKGDD